MPDSPNTADTLGWVLYKRGVASAAVGYLREAEAGMNPDDFRHRYAEAARCPFSDRRVPLESVAELAQ